MLDTPLNFIIYSREHQRILSKLMYYLTALYYDSNIFFEPLSNVMLDESCTSPVPDIILFSEDEYMNKVIIEITTPTTFKKDFQKVENLVDEYDVKEGFVYDYKKFRWRKYKNGVGEVIENPSFCDTIGYDLNDFVK